MASRAVLSRCAISRSPPSGSLLPRTLNPAYCLFASANPSQGIATTPSVRTDPGPPVNPQEPLAPSAPVLKQHLTIADRIALRFRDYLPNTTETYIAYDVTRELYTECASQAAYVDGTELSPSARFWYQVCNRQPTFTGWAQVTMLHMWMIAARLRTLDKQRVSIWQQHFIDHFFYDSEDKMVKRYGLKRGGQRTGYMKDLYHQYRGMVAALDESLMKGDTVLATTLWRNIFDAAEGVDLEVLAMITSYVRRVVFKLGRIEDDVILKGAIAFGIPTEEAGLVKRWSRLLEDVGKEA